MTELRLQLPASTPAVVRPVARQMVPAIEEVDELTGDMSAERDAWQAAARNLQTELWRQMDMLRSIIDQHQSDADLMRAELEQQRVLIAGLRAEADRHDSQVAQLGAAMTASTAPAQSRPVPLTVPAAETAPASVATKTGVDVPAGLGLVPLTRPAPSSVDSVVPPMVVPSLAPDLRPKVKSRLRLRTPPKSLSAKEAAIAAPIEPAAPATAAPEAVEFTAPVPETGGGEILPNVPTDKRRRRFS